MVSSCILFAWLNQALYVLATDSNDCGICRIRERKARRDRHPPAPAAARPSVRRHAQPHYVVAVFEHEIGIRLNDNERKDVEEYCISEGWVKVSAGKTVDRKGHPILIKLKGKVEAFYR